MERASSAPEAVGSSKLVGGSEGQSFPQKQKQPKIIKNIKNKNIKEKLFYLSYSFLICPLYHLLLFKQPNGSSPLSLLNV
jgi:hypothetical protein